MRARAFAGLCLVGAAACGGSATSPTIDRLNLPTGAMILEIVAPTSPTTLPCTPASFFGLHHARVTLTHEGSDWIARSTTPADGDVELRFRDAGGTLADLVAGTVTGSANEASTMPPFPAWRATYAGAGTGPAAFSGHVNNIGAISTLVIFGNATGTIRFLDPVTGATAGTCASVSAQLIKTGT